MVKPNIQLNGRIARAISGLLCIAAGVLAWWMVWPESGTVRVVGCTIAIVAGLFQLYEAKTAWCVARACGIKTPM